MCSGQSQYSIQLHYNPWIVGFVIELLVRVHLRFQDTALSPSVSKPHQENGPHMNIACLEVPGVVFVRGAVCVSAWFLNDVGEIQLHARPADHVCHKPFRNHH